MSVAWDVGFRARPELDKLDEFMKSLGFHAERGCQRQDFTRIYVFDDNSVEREIVFFYNKRARKSQTSFFPGEEIASYGSLVTYSIDDLYSEPAERARSSGRKKSG